MTLADLLKRWAAKDNRIVEVRRIVRDLLLSADCNWEQDDAGHDWRGAVRAARAWLERSEIR